MKWKSIEQRREYYRKWREKHREELRIYQRQYYRKHHPECLNYNIQWKKEHRKQHNAQRMAENAVRLGKIKKRPCVICGNPNSEMHHQDYNKPLEIVWLCRSCHKKLHLGQLVEEINNYLKTESKKNKGRRKLTVNEQKNS